jgi:hypothetical protein
VTCSYSSLRTVSQHHAVNAVTKGEAVSSHFQTVHVRNSSHNTPPQPHMNPPRMPPRIYVRLTGRDRPGNGARTMAFALLPSRMVTVAPVRTNARKFRTYSGTPPHSTFQRDNGTAAATSNILRVARKLRLCESQSSSRRVHRDTYAHRALASVIPHACRRG